MPGFDQLSDQQISNIVDYLASLSTKSPSAGVSSTPSTSSLSGGAKQGEQLFDKVGCLGCHMVNGKGGTVGPDLSNAANEGHSREWLETQIRNPKAHDPQSSMPGFDQLSDQQIGAMVDYLETLSTTSKPSGQSGQQRGRQLFETLACQECHRVGGKGGTVGPDLSDEGNKGRSREWLETQIRNPRAHMLQTSMPAWGDLPEQQVDDLVDYLESLKAGPGPSGPGPAGGT
jgi:sulfur oxidation c-type cytochrome SoxX